MTQLTFGQALELAWTRIGEGKFDEAESICRQVLQHDPNNADAFNAIGMIALTLQNFPIAEQLFDRATTLVPLEPKFQHNHAEALAGLGKYDSALFRYRRAIETGDFPLTHTRMGNLLMYVGEVEDAMAAHRRAIELDPNYATAHNNLGMALQAQGRIDEAMVELREAMRLDPTLDDAHNNLLYTMHMTSAATPAEIFAAHRAWAAQHASGLPAPASHARDRSPDRRLRIGLVSADLMNQPVGRFLLPLVQKIDSSQFEMIFFSDTNKFDAVSEKLQRKSQGWHATAHLDDQQLAEFIRQHEIDILFDLAGHTVGNRLLAFARKPAPIQVTYLGYPDTTGLTAMDYRITDALADPLGETDAFHTERLVRLPHCFLCFPPVDIPAELTPPHERTGGITFASFNHFGKISRDIASIWARVLDAVPGSRLLIKSRHHAGDTTRAVAVQHLLDYGLPADRFTLLVRDTNPVLHMQAYSQVDIALDTFPYHGTTTTCDALWMGAPVITLAGKTHASRVSVSLLTNAGLPDLVARDADDYVRIAAALASDRQRLAQLRKTLRDQMLSSPLMDAAGFTRGFEQVLRTMWRDWCAGGGPETAPAAP